jgi:GT2 family glycosyltransferase
VETDPQQAPSVVSVVVVHQPGDWFDETLAALAAQDYPNVRHLFITTAATSQASTEPVTERIRRFLPGAFVRGVEGNPGFGTVADEVLRLVEGDNGFFLICHDDVAPAPDAVRAMVTELYRSNAGMVGPKLVDWDEPRRLQHVGLGLDRFGEADPIVEAGEFDQEQHDAVRDVFVLPSACLLVRADLFRSLGGFDPALTFHGEDVELCWRAHLNGARVVVAPDAVVRHRERLEERRPDLDHRQLRARHRMRAVATLTGGSRLLARSVQLVLLTVAELVVGLFTGKIGEAVASLRALVGLVPRSGSIIARRGAVRGQRAVPEREVLGLQVRGSARLASFLRARETTTYVGAGTTVRRWRDASIAPFLAWTAVVLAIVIGSRSFIDRGVPVVGEFLPFPDSPRDLLSTFASAWDARSLGSETATPTGWVVLAAASVLALFRMDLAMTMSVIGAFLLGAAGTWRLATVYPATRARVAALVVYVGTPLVPGAMATGRWSVLAWYAALPWLVHLLRRCAGIETADPSMDAIDLRDGVMDLGARERIRRVAVLSLVVAVTVAFVPATVVLWCVVGLVLAGATLLAGGALRTAGWLAGATVTSAVAAALLNLPWSTTWTWEHLVGADALGGDDIGLVDLASLTLDDRAFTVLAIALYVTLLAALAITRAWRLTWAVRAAGLVVVFGGAAVLADRDALGIAAPEAGLLLVPVLLGLALAGGSIAGSFETDVRARGFGWRQPAAIAAEVAIAIAVVPGVASIADGSWDAPRTTVPVLLAAQFPPDPTDGDYRVLYVGDPRVLPVPATEYRPGIAYAVVDDGPLAFTDRWAPPATDADDAVVDALDHIASGATLRAGRLLAPLGIRWIVVPESTGGITSGDDLVPVATGLLEALGDQLDLGEAYGPPNVDVFANRAWIPVTAQLTGPTADASRLEGDAELIRADLTSAVAAFVGADHLAPTSGPVSPGVVHVAVPFGDGWSLDVEDADAPARAGFGVATAFDVGAEATGTLEYRSPPSRAVWLVVMSIVWLAAFVLASRARSPFNRWRGVVNDETLIALHEPIVLPTQHHEPGVESENPVASLDDLPPAWATGAHDDGVTRS